MKRAHTVFTCLYATREKHPTYRVDLTELFSVGIAGKGHSIDWHMQAMACASSGWTRLSDNERVCVGRAFSGRNIFSKALNQIVGLHHDLRLYRLAFKRAYDFIQVRDKIFAGFIGLLAAKARGIPFYYWMSFPYPEADRFRARDPQIPLSFALRSFYRLRGAWTAWLLYRIVLPRAAHIFVQSDRMKADVALQGIAPERMTAVPMGINLDRVANRGTEIVADTATTSQPQSKPTLVYVGSMVRLRRIDFLLDMLKRVQEHVPETELVLVGDGLPRDMAFLRSEAGRLGVAGQVRFTGFVPMEQAWDFIRGADVCLSPFAPNPILDSTSPTKVVEYMAFNKVVVANRHPDQGKLLDDSGAGYAVAYDPQAFADAVVSLLLQPDHARAMGARGLDYVRRHRSYAALSAALEARYLELLGRNPAPQFAGAPL